MTEINIPFRIDAERWKADREQTITMMFTPGLISFDHQLTRDKFLFELWWAQVLDHANMLVPKLAEALREILSQVASYYATHKNKLDEPLLIRLDIQDVQGNKLTTDLTLERLLADLGHMFKILAYTSVEPPHIIPFSMDLGEVLAELVRTHVVCNLPEFMLNLRLCPTFDENAVLESAHAAQYCCGRGKFITVSDIWACRWMLLIPKRHLDKLVLRFKGEFPTPRELVEIQSYA